MTKPFTKEMQTKIDTLLKTLKEIIEAGIWCLEYYDNDPPYKWGVEE